MNVFQTYFLLLLQKSLYYMFDQFSTMYNSLERIKSSQSESAFHALSRYMFKYFLPLMVRFFNSKS
jgi:hypothetical protein